MDDPLPPSPPRSPGGRDVAGLVGWGLLLALALGLLVMRLLGGGC